jgi:molybdopterin-guanine dinucleotide biosynthesis adapter protein
MKVFGIAGWSGSGKTTLLIRLIPVLVRRGIEVATIKHTHHNPVMGGDESRALFAAGATETVFAAPERFALVHEYRVETEAALEEMARRAGRVDLLLVEGYKFSRHPKLEVWDPDLGKPLLAYDHPSVVAIASDTPLKDCGYPVFRRDDVGAIADFILSYKG